MYLSHNQLSRKIPEDSSLPFQLEYLDIGSNSLEGGIPKSFWINACKLKSLILYNNRFNDELQVIIHHLSRCARYSLQELDLSYNQFNGTLPDLSIFSFLEIFDISKNRLNGKILEDIRFPTKLRTLWMDSNSLNGVISDFQFSGMSMLRELDLSDNSLALRFTENWIPPFQLHHIGLRSCKLGPSFPKWIQTQKYFEELDISNAGISDNVPEWFWTKLSTQVKNSKSSGPILPFLRGSEYIDLSKNKFSDSHPFLCAYGIDVTLGQFDLSNNRLSDEIPDCWSNFKSLAYLDLSHNNFSGKIPTSMGSLVQLQALDLSSNHFSEEIPPEIANLIQLVSLNLSRNNMTGKIPSNIGKLASLDFLDLSRNKLLGSIPSSLSQIDRIGVLDLSHNQLSGEIPRSTQLQSFNASSYEDNLDLCGPPLVKLCVEGNSPHEPKVKIQDDEDLLLSRGFYISVTFGFIFGFWGMVAQRLTAYCAASLKDTLKSTVGDDSALWRTCVFGMKLAAF
ncbi:receptor protein EIX2 [Trifolium repens]|nr:receptor protein EIX2 [Trifolium repens]